MTKRRKHSVSYLRRNSVRRVSCPPEAQPVEPAGHRPSTVPSAGKSVRGYSSHGVVEQSVQQRSGQNIVAEQFPPIAEILVAGQDDTAVLIPFRYQTEQQLSFLAVQLPVDFSP